MRDIGVARVTVVCTDSCGCPVPCTGDAGCRCISRENSSAADDPEASFEHKRCSCGEHCGCNPCRCSTTTVQGVGKTYCVCGTGCTCATCVA